ncbi:MAG TPA: type IV secretory system conjugative DNA transfer family protein [Bryobacteraceae bacterium]|nr:type IV secretory system conjugative DNA transfer family protein [Bryobacteraceae bacterium]
MKIVATIALGILAHSWAAAACSSVTPITEAAPPLIQNATRGPRADEFGVRDRAEERAMHLNKKLLRRFFPDAEICGRLRGGYLIKTRNGGRLVVTADKFEDWKGGADIYEPAMHLWRALHGDRPMVAAGSLLHIMNSVIFGQAAGVKVEAGGTKRWFGLIHDPPPAIPKPSGAHGTAEICSDATLRQAGLTGGKCGEGLRIGEDSAGNIVRYTGDNSSVFVIGPPGSGKQVSLLTTLETEADKTSFLLLDWKSEHLAISYRRRKELGPTHVICPYKEGLPDACARFADTTDSYNPVPVLLDPTSESYVANTDALAAILIAQDGSGEIKETGFFTGNGQMAVSGVLMQLVENYPDEATLPHMASIVCTNRIFEFAATAMKTGSPYVRDRLATFATPDAPLLKGGIADILRTMREQLKWLSDPAMARVLSTPKTPWRFDDLKRGPRPSTVFVCVPPKFAGTARRFFRLLLGCAFMELQATPQGTWPVTCVADEFPLLGKAEIFPIVFAEGRGHGIRVIGVCQSAGQMIAAYGEQGFRNFLACSGLQLWFPPRDYQTAAEISRLAGRKTIITMNHSQSPGRGGAAWGGISVAETGMDVLTPHQVMALDSTKLIAFAPGLVPGVMILNRKNYWEYPDIKRHTDANPYAPGYKPPRPIVVPKPQPPRPQETLDAKIARWNEAHKREDRGKKS